MGSTLASRDGSFRATGGSALKTALAVLALLLCIPLAAEAQTTASLRVIIVPQEAIEAGAQWRVDGGAWRDSATTFTSQWTQRVAVDFQDLAQWRTPEPIQQWVFNGHTKVTTATYYRAIDYDVGGILAQTVWMGDTLQFFVHSEQLGSSATLTAAADSAPVGAMTTDLNTSGGLFAYTPDASDKFPFDVTFTASLPGHPDSPISQRATITPLCELPDEQLVFGLSPELTLPGGGQAHDAADVYVTSRTFAGVFNVYRPGALRAVTITGEEIIFEEGHENGLYERFNYVASPQKNADISTMTINAETLIVRGPLRLPGTNVVINAWELRFEDGAATASLCTTPLSDTTTPAPAQKGETAGRDGTPGEKAGDLILNIGSFHAPPSSLPRFVLRGGAGQNAGAGRKGDDGYSPTDGLYLSEYKWGPMRADLGIPVSQTIDYKPPEDLPHYYYLISYVSNTVPWPWTSDYWPSKDSAAKTEWPKSGENATPSGKPGRGGGGGGVRATLDVQSCVDRSSGSPGARALGNGWRGDYWSGGQWGEPRWAMRLWITWTYWFPLYFTANITEEKNPDAPTFPGASASVPYADPPGPPGDLRTTATFTLAPALLRRILASAKDEYLFGDLSKAEARLSKFAELIDAIESTWDHEADYNRAQLEMLTLRDEMRTLLHRITSNLDYFGNPAGWVPMLSFEVESKAFSDEIDHAINVMYLGYWVRNMNRDLRDRAQGMRQLQKALAAEVEKLKTAYAEAVETIPWIETEAANITAKTHELREDSLALVDELERQAARNLEPSYWEKVLMGAQLGAKISGALAKVFPVGQPYVGAVGGVFDVFGNFDVKDPWGSGLTATLGVADLTATFTDELYKDKLAKVTEQVKKVDPKDAEISTRTQTLNALAKGTAALSKGLKGVTDVVSKFKVPEADVQAELKKLIAESKEFKDIALKIEGLIEKKKVFMRKLAAATQAVTEFPNLISRDMLAINTLAREIDRAEAALSPETVDYINEIERRARERLLRYHYYMAKAYEYRILKPYPGRLDLEEFNRNILNMAKAVSSTCTLTQQDFEALKTPYREQIREAADSIFTEYLKGRIELSAPISFLLTAQQIEQVNSGEPLEINLMEMGMFSPGEENVRIVKFNVVGIQAHLEGQGSTRWAWMDLKLEHSGISHLMNKGEVYRFRHYNPMTENPIVWGLRYDWFKEDPITPIEPSAASNSLLLSLLSEGAAKQDMLLYSRPAAWADIVVTKEVNAENDVDIVIDSLRLEVVYDFVPKPSGQSQLKVLTSQPGFQPYFIVDKEDLNARQDGRGGFYRTFSAQGAVTIQAQPGYGQWRFQKWTDVYGNDFATGSVTGSAVAATWPVRGLNAAPWTNPVIAVDLSTHQTVKAKYVLLLRPEGPSPGDGETTAPLNASLDWRDVADATRYDLFFWRFGDAKPTTPTAAGLTVSNYTPAANLDPYTSYTWQVVVWADNVMTEGREWDFRTGDYIATPTPTPGPEATPTPEEEPIRALIRSFYQIILGREPEAGAVNSWHHGYFDYAVSFNIDVRFIPREMARLFFLSEEYAMRNRTNPEFITDCYRVFLSRDPNQTELDNWLAGVWNRSEVMTIFSESEEFANRIQSMYPQYGGNPTRNFVTAMYIGLLDRLVDQSGLDYASGLFDAALASGGVEACRAQAKQMAREVIVSEEFLSKSPTTAVYVSRFYRAFLGRFPNDTEVTYWSGELDSGRQSASGVIELFADSAEFTSRLNAYFGP